MKQDENFEQDIRKRNNSISVFRLNNIIAIIIGVLLLPILVINCCLIVSGIINPNKIPSVNGYTPLIVLTESMEPKIKSGDLIICKKVSSNYIEEGMIISFFDPSGNGQTIVTHKINRIEIDEEVNAIYYYTQGINNNIEDRNPVSFDNVIGVYTGVRLAWLGQFILFIQKPVGLLICIVIPILIFLLIWYLKQLINKNEKNKETFDAQNRIIELETELKTLKETIKNKDKIE